MTIEQDNDHVRRTLRRLRSQFQEKPNIAALVSAFAAEMQGIEDALFSLLTQRLLASAVGVQLDTMGRIVKRAREGLGDDDYRAVLTAWIRANRSGGTGNDIIDVLRLALGNSNFTFTSYPPASFIVDIRGALELSASVVASLIRRARLGGVGSHVVYSDLSADESFAFYGGAVDANTEEFDADVGLGSDTDPSVGGVLAAVRTA